MPAELTVRPSLRRAKYSLALCIIFLCLVIWFWLAVMPDAKWWILGVGALPFLGPLLAWLDSTRTLMVVDDGIIRYRHGLVSQTTRSIELRKIQDIRVERSLSQRLWGIGTLVLETAGESSRLSMADIDRPQQVADWLLNESRKRGLGQANG
ncbi:MAG: PH domain-containing protein [Candidatus Solibacter usitatus]|nr:PH domain-containing protein [Candidatus Solibacter usitatus]